MRDLKGVAALAFAVVAATCAVLAGGAHAQSAPGNAPKVLLIDPGDSELSARIAGQTKDLPLRFESADREPDPGHGRAQALADKRAAAAVVWIAPAGDGGLQVHVLDALRGSERTRDVPAQPAGEQLGSSAVFEAAALVVRGELSNLLEQEALAARAAEAEAERTRAAERSAGTAGSTKPGSAKPGNAAGNGSDEPDEPDEPDRPYRRPGAWSLRAGARAALVDSGAVAYGPLLGLGLDVGAVAFGLQATTAWPIESEHQGVALRFKRHGVALHALAFALDGRVLRLLAGIDAGVVLYARRADIRSGTLQTTPPKTTVSAAFGAVTELQWLPTPTIGAALTVGLDLLTAPTQFGLRRGSATPEVLQKLSWYEPWATLSIVFRFGRPSQ